MPYSEFKYAILQEIRNGNYSIYFWDASKDNLDKCVSNLQFTDKVVKYTCMYFVFAYQ